MMHHMNSEEISSFWEYERRRYRKDQSPLLFKEVFQDLIYPKLQHSHSREDWDNFSDDWYYIDFDRPDHQWEEWRVGRSVLEEKKTETERRAHASWQDCQAACDEHAECFQYFWHNECCAMHRSFRLGTPRKKSDDETLRHISGWNLDRIDQWLEQNGGCDDRIDWPELVRAAIEKETKKEEETTKPEESAQASERTSADADADDEDDGTASEETDKESSSSSQEI